MPEKVRQIYNSLIKDFSVSANKKRSVEMKGYMRNQFDFFGLTAPIRKDLEKSHILMTKTLQYEELCELILLLWDAPERELQYTAMNIIRKNVKRVPADGIQLVETTILSKSWWDTVDFLASNPVGSLFTIYPDQKTKYVTIWRKSFNIWLRRVCLLFQLKYRDRTDIGLLESLILENLNDNEFFIQKACGWALRQYSRVDPDFVINFAENTKELSKLARTEALKWMINTGRY